MDNLKKRVIEMIVKRCKLNDVDLDTVDCDAPLFISADDYSEQGLELDSVDALELVAGAKESFNVVIEADNMNVFYSVNTLTEYIKENMETEG